MTKTGYPELSLADQRTRLVGALAPLAAQSGAEITVAFDGGARPPVQPPAPRGVRVLFSAADEIADDLIRRLVAAEPAGRPVVVVTSDRQVVTGHPPRRRVVGAVGGPARPPRLTCSRPLADPSPGRRRKLSDAAPSVPIEPVSAGPTRGGSARC